MRHLTLPGAALTMLAVPLFAEHMTIPTGSELSIRTNEAINSETAREGESFDAQVYADVTGDRGRVLIPRGSPAQLVVRDFDKGGLTGTRELELGLQSVSVNGRSYLVGATAEAKADKRGLGANKRTAVMTGGGAALGAVIGAIAGGGKGAAIGAATGAGAGAVAQVMTRGSKIQVPAESVLTFKLKEPIELHTDAPPSSTRSRSSDQR